MPARPLRADFTAGLRQLADWLDANPDINLPADGTTLPLTFSAWGKDGRDKAREFAKAFPGKLDKDVDESYYRLRGQMGGVSVEFCAYRDYVCERVVIGEREVTVQIPDPDVDVPMVEVTQTIEDVEWICPPLLAEAEA